LGPVGASLRALPIKILKRKKRDVVELGPVDGVDYSRSDETTHRFTGLWIQPEERLEKRKVTNLRVVSIV
jgi:hypothetical protein